MKKIHIFAYCDGILKPDVVFYDVMVGISERDRRAHQFISRLTASDNRFFYAKNSIEVAEFLNNIALSIFPAQGKRVPSMAWLRSKRINVTDLAAFLRKNPAALLNSASITQRIDQSAVSSGLITEENYAKRAFPLLLTEPRNKPK